MVQTDAERERDRGYKRRKCNNTKAENRTKQHSHELQNIRRTKEKAAKMNSTHGTPQPDMPPSAGSYMASRPALPVMTPGSKPPPPVTTPASKPPPPPATPNPPQAVVPTAVPMFWSPEEMKEMMKGMSAANKKEFWKFVTSRVDKLNQASADDHAKEQLAQEEDERKRMRVIDLTSSKPPPPPATPNPPQAIVPTAVPMFWRPETMKEMMKGMSAANKKEFWKFVTSRVDKFNRASADDHAKEQLAQEEDERKRMLVIDERMLVIDERMLLIDERMLLIDLTSSNRKRGRADRKAERIALEEGLGMVAVVAFGGTLPISRPPPPVATPIPPQALVPAAVPDFLSPERMQGMCAANKKELWKFATSRVDKIKQASADDHAKEQLAQEEDERKRMRVIDLTSSNRKRDLADLEAERIALEEGLGRVAVVACGGTLSISRPPPPVTTPIPPQALVPAAVPDFLRPERMQGMSAANKKEFWKFVTSRVDKFNQASADDHAKEQLAQEEDERQRMHVIDLTSSNRKRDRADLKADRIALEKGLGRVAVVAFGGTLPNVDDGNNNNNNPKRIKTSMPPSKQNQPLAPVQTNSASAACAKSQAPSHSGRKIVKGLKPMANTSCTGEDPMAASSTLDACRQTLYSGGSGGISLGSSTGKSGKR